MAVQAAQADREETLSDFVKRCRGILEEGLKWAPSLVRAHLADYLLQLARSSDGLRQHTGLALATEAVLAYAGYTHSAGALGVNICP
ncbi:unnamed protein product [Protopolystoma xenopodis]|uniref:Uncharacterized protein n=1 Tax=Protopolystoma xenopodis TaxID=117903 RepID=A0A448XGJ0_9PLAT|nr:unnamed protein product [Protopolystoma xenopodis]